MEDTTIQDVLKTFQAHYAQKDYANALLVLQKGQSELSPGIWHYHVGLVKAQTLQWAEARFHFLKARELGFNSQQNSQNLMIAESKLELGKLEKPLSTSDFLIKGALWASEGAFTTVSLLVLISAIIGLRKKRDYKLASFYAVGIAVPLVLGLWISSWPKAIVIQPQMVLEGPSAIFSTRVEIPVGIFIVTNANDDWQEIIYPSRFSGWIKKAGIKSLESAHE